MNNRMYNCKNPHQGDAKKVLCVCSAGLLRSPTTAWVLSNPPYNFNTRAVGVDKGHALIPVDEVLIAWADEIVCMSKEHLDVIAIMAPDRTIINLNIPDMYGFRNEELISIINKRCAEEFE